MPRPNNKSATGETDTGMVVDQEWLEGVSFADLGGHDVLRKEGALCDELLETDPELGDGCEGDGLGLSFESDTESESLEYDFEDLDGEVESDAELRRQNLRGQLIFLVREFFDSDPGYLKKSLSVLNKEAAAFQKAGDNMSAIAAYAKLFAKVAKKRLTHPELYVTHCNRSSAYLKLELFEEALWDAMQCMKLAEEELGRNAQVAHQMFVKSHAKKGLALLGLERYRAASSVFNQGLQMDPFSKEMKRGLEEAQRKILEELLTGKSQRIKALPSTRPFQGQRITMQPYSAPLHKIRNEDMLPRQLLTPFQAENDYHVKDTYNYMTVQGDVRMPKAHFTFLEDFHRHELFREAIFKAVGDISKDRDCRVLNLGAGAGLNTMMCLEAGARHVTAVERWLYLAMSSKEVLLSNGFNDDQVKVIYKRPTDLALLKDVPVICNLLLCDILDDGLLTSGLIPAAKHALSELMTDQAVVIPCSATVYVQAGQVQNTEVCGFDVSCMNRHRWMPAFASGAPFDDKSFVPLSAPVEVWQFDMLTPPEEASRDSLDLKFSRSGVFNAVRFWYDLHLYDNIHLSTGPEAVEMGLKSLRPAVQFMKGQMVVREGDVIPLTAMHNTVRIKFDIEDAEFSSLTRPDASFPQNQFSFLSDTIRNEAYYRAIERVVARMKGEGKEVHALDMGCGSSLLSMMAARCGADSVVAAELHDGLCDTARHIVARNGLSDKITVVNKDVGLLERGTHIRALGANLVVADFFDSGLLHDNFMFLLERVKSRVLQQDYNIVPAAATIYCMGIESFTKDVQGFDFSSFNKYRWDKDYEAVDLSTLRHRKLTKPKKVFEFFFQGDRKGRSRENVLKLEVVNPGHMNAIIFWFDLHLDEQETITSAPPGVEMGGVVTQDYGQLREGSASGAFEDNDDGTFIASDAFVGEKKGYAFKKGELGQGYYVDFPCGRGEQQNASFSLAEAEEAIEPPLQDGHHWGQALQYLERAVRVQPKKRITVLAKREGNVIKFSLKEGVGSRVGKAPWKVEWGGGASVENPHYQRVHYCQLLVSDFLMRLRSKRFPPIEKDMKMMLANCGNLFLDPAVVTEVYHEFVVLEMIHGQPEFCPGASLEAITKRILKFS